MPSCTLLDDVDSKLSTRLAEIKTPRFPHWPSWIQIIDGHTQVIRAIAYSPDGSRIASASEDQSIRIWKAIGGALLNVLEGHSGPVHSVVFSSNGSLVASGSSDKSIRIWDASSGASIISMTGHTDTVISVQFSPDGESIVSASLDDSVRVWSLFDGTPRNILDWHHGHIRSMSICSLDGEAIFNTQDGSAILWNIQANRTRYLSSGETRVVLCSAYSPDGRYIASGSGEGVVYVDDREDQLVATLHGHQGPINGVAFSPTGRYIVSGSEDRTVVVWNVVECRRLLTLRGHLRPVTSVAFSPDELQIISSAGDMTLRLWDFRPSAAVQVARPDSTTSLLRVDGNWGRIWHIAFSPDNSRIACAMSDCSVKIFDTVGNVILTLAHPNPQDILQSYPVFSVAFSPSGHMLASGSADGYLRLWDTATGNLIATTSARRSYPSYGHDDTIIFSPEDKIARIWNDISGPPLKRLDDGRLSGLSTVSTRVWPDAGSFRIIPLRQIADAPVSVNFSHDGQEVVYDMGQATAQGRWNIAPLVTNVANSSVSVGPQESPSQDHARTDPSAEAGLSSRHHFTMDGEGWLRNATGQRLLWLPRSRRPAWPDAGQFSGRLFAAGSRNGVLTVLDMSPYLDRTTPLVE